MTLEELEGRIINADCMDILRDYSEDGALILDPFSGSGTTALAARILKRRFVCIEKDAEYWRASVERLEEAKKQGELF